MAKARFERAFGEVRNSASDIRRNLEAFSESATIFSSDKPRLIDKHENRWVGVYNGRIAASGKTLSSITAKLKKEGIPLAETMIRRIDKEDKTLIL